MCVTRVFARHFRHTLPDKGPLRGVLIEGAKDQVRALLARPRPGPGGHEPGEPGHHVLGEGVEIVADVGLHNELVFRCVIRETDDFCSVSAVTTQTSVA
jgi:hypothetical protein